MCLSLPLAPCQLSDESNQLLDYGAAFSRGLVQDTHVVQVRVLLFPGCWAPYLIPWFGPNGFLTMDGSGKHDRNWGGTGSRSSCILVCVGSSPLSQGSACSSFRRSDLGNLGPAKPWPPTVAQGDFFSHSVLLLPAWGAQSFLPLAHQPAFP